MTLARPAADDTRWNAVRRRAAAEFRYAVRTTGVYCRPGCPSRLPRRQNVEFFATASEAERAGYRPCKRCQPDRAAADPRAEAIGVACRAIETADAPPLLDHLARAAAMSPSAFHRAFKAIVGVTPKQYAAAIQARRVRDGLRAGETVTEALYDAGYGAASRFYEQSRRVLGMLPSAYAAGGPGEAIRYAMTRTSLGWMLVAATAIGVCAIAFADERAALADELRGRFPHASIAEGDAAFRDWVGDVAARLDADPRGLDLPLDIRGTAFQRRVWQALRDIPAGETRAYGEVARGIGQPQAARAVASACARNPVAVATPCHRVVRADGALGGYRWGVERKRRLLDRERRRP